MESKKCNKCGLDKTVDNFANYLDKRVNKKRRAFICKTCMTLYKKEQRHKDPHETKLRYARYRNRNPITYYYGVYRYNSKMKGREFSLTKEQFKELVLKECYYCGQKENPINGVDRMDSSYGYNLINSVPCCSRCNKAKMDLSVDEFLQLCEDVYLNMKLKTKEVK